jgi:hypothetical protein
VEGELQVIACVDTDEIAMRRVWSEQAHDVAYFMTVDQELYGGEGADDDFHLPRGVA